MDHYRAQRPELAGEEGEEAIARAEGPEHETPEALALTAENAAQLRRAIATLPGVQREAVLLRFVEELSLEEIAAITGVGRETAKSRLRYALQKLRQELPHAR